MQYPQFARIAVLTAAPDNDESSQRAIADIVADMADSSTHSRRVDAMTLSGRALLRRTPSAKVELAQAALRAAGMLVIVCANQAEAAVRTVALLTSAERGWLRERTVVIVPTGPGPVDADRMIRAALRLAAPGARVLTATGTLREVGVGALVRDVVDISRLVPARTEGAPERVLIAC